MLDRYRARRRRVELVTGPGCHLCDDARAVVGAVTGRLGVPVAERDVHADDDDLRRWALAIPVVLVDGVEVARYRVDAAALRRVLVRGPGRAPAAGPSSA